MDPFFEQRLNWHAHRSLAGKYPKGEIAASTTYAREVIALRNQIGWLLDQINRATVAHMTETSPANGPSTLRWVDEVPEPTGGKFGRTFEHDDVVQTLKANPGQWAIIGDGLQGVRKTAVESFRNHGISTRTRTLQGPAHDSKGHKLVVVYGAYFPPVEENQDDDPRF